jgi:SAM-dependent methyltransferase
LEHVPLVERNKGALNYPRIQGNGQFNEEAHQMGKTHEDERRFHAEPARLRSTERLARLELDRVVDLSIEGLVVESVLDVGTGTGVFAEAFSKRPIRVAGLDNSSELLSEARRHVPGVEFREGQAEAIPFADGSFDLVFLGFVIHEMANPLKALEEARRVAKYRVSVLEWPYRDEEHGPPIEHRVRPEAVEGLSEQAGFLTVEHIELVYMDFYRFTR